MQQRQRARSGAATQSRCHGGAELHAMGAWLWLLRLQWRWRRLRRTGSRLGRQRTNGASGRLTRLLLLLLLQLLVSHVKETGRIALAHSNVLTAHQRARTEA